MSKGFKHKISVYGAGKWGSAIHFAISRNHDAKLSSHNPRDFDYFVTPQEAYDSQYLVVSIASQKIREWLENDFVYKGQKILVASKGIEAESGKFLNAIFEEYIPAENLAYLSGPSFATEVMQSLPTAVVINAIDRKLAKKFSRFFPNFMKTYTSKDIIGAEVSGAYKNVLAIAAGISDGLELGNNTRATLISRGLVEMDRFGKFFGAKKKTFLGLSGAGDLFLTASSTLSRNFRVGLGLAKGKSQEQILEELGEVAEGVLTATAIYKLSKEHGIYTPIATEVYHILHGKDIKHSIHDLLNS
jgi:glycerol-3-phosphate dehydrogenase (NAD(P)+)